MSLEQQLQQAFSDEQVSDVHVEEGRGLWVRVSGHMRSLPAPVTRAELDAFFSAHQRDTGIEPAKLDGILAKRGDADFAFALPNARVRANVFRSSGKLCLALRRIQPAPKTLAELGLPSTTIEALINRGKGLFLVTGAAGTGKSTTLAACIEHINSTAPRHILTIEDPIEYTFTQKQSLIQQRQIGRDVPNWEAALRGALREDPDVLMLGEIRDAETLEAALNAANTGHLVLGTMHTVGARQTLERISMLFPPEAQARATQSLSSVLIGVLSQTLVVRADKQGRALAYELLLNTGPITQALKDGKANQIFSAMETGRSAGHVLLNSQLRQLVQDKIIAKSEAIYVTYDPSGLEKELAYVR